MKKKVIINYFFEGVSKVTKKLAIKKINAVKERRDAEEKKRMDILLEAFKL